MKKLLTVAAIVLAVVVSTAQRQTPGNLYFSDSYDFGYNDYSGDYDFEE